MTWSKFVYNQFAEDGQACNVTTGYKCKHINYMQIEYSTQNWLF